jgi:F0F1-type ATP synthase membrane subunit b/b'
MNLDETLVLALSFATFVYFAYRPARSFIIASLDNRIFAIKKRFSAIDDIKHKASLSLNEAERKIAGLDDIKTSRMQEVDLEIKYLTNLHNEEMRLLLNYKKTEMISATKQHETQIMSELQSEILREATKLVQRYFLSSKNSFSDLEIANYIANKSIEPKSLSL